MDNLKVVIVEPGWLATGIALGKAGYEVEIYDRVRTPPCGREFPSGQMG